MNRPEIQQKLEHRLNDQWGLSVGGTVHRFSVTPTNVRECQLLCSNFEVAIDALTPVDVEKQAGEVWTMLDPIICAMFGYILAFSGNSWHESVDQWRIIVRLLNVIFG